MVEDLRIRALDNAYMSGPRTAEVLAFELVLRSRTRVIHFAGDGRFCLSCSRGRVEFIPLSRRGDRDPLSQIVG